MQFVNIGFGNLVSADRLIALVSPDSAPVKRLVQEARDHVVLSALPAERLAPRLGLAVKDLTEEDE